MNAQDTADGALFELFMSPEGRADPYPLYRRIREVAPLFRSGMGAWFCTSYEAGSAVLRDSRMARPPADLRFEVDRPEWAPLVAAQQRSMLFANPPDHTRIRGLVAKAFTPRVVEGMRPYVAGMVDAILDEAAERGELDVIDALSYPLPITVICEMLGIPDVDRDAIRAWTRTFVATLEPVVTDEAYAAAVRATVESEAYLRSVVDERRSSPGDDLISTLIAVEEEGEGLTTDELIANLNLLLGAGFETTMNLVGNGMLALLRHPDEMAQLRSDPSLMRNAVEELLRYDGSVQIAGPRLAEEDVTVGDVTIPAGEVVAVLLGAANRDPARFEDPDRLDVDRPDPHPLTFGGGIHFCLGAALARLEAQEAIGRLLRRFDVIELLDDEPQWHPTFNLRGLKSLPVAVKA